MGPRATEPGANETGEAIRHASQLRSEAVRRGREVESVAQRLRVARQRNHFGELITMVLKEGK